MTIESSAESDLRRSGPPLPLGARIRLGMSLLRRRVKEYVTGESRTFQSVAGLAAFTAARLFGLLGRERKEFLLLTKLHRAGFLGIADARAEKLARQAAHRQNPAIDALFRDHIDQVAPTRHSAKFFDNPRRLLGPIVMVVKSPDEREKGVILLQYSQTFPMFAKLFDVERITERYYLVMEPDWSGYCDANILSYCRYDFPVFVQAYEPRDGACIEAVRSNLVGVPISANWWVDHRLFRPLPEVRKDMDVVMVAGWGDYKRHHRFFAGLARLRRAGRALRVLLLGYPLGMTRESILREAAYYRVDDQLEVHESVPFEQVNAFINRAKVNVIWSRREGVNRAIIEGMLAGVPCLVRDGFNYGYRYPYINDQTGGFATERGLPEKLAWMVDNHSRFAPRDWILSHMSPHHASQILSDTIERSTRAAGLSWSGNLAVKVNKLHGMEYWDADDAKRFTSDYEFIMSQLRQPPAPTPRQPVACSTSG